MGIEMVFGDSFASIKLGYSAADFRVDVFSVLCGLTSYFVAETAQGANEFFTANIAGQLQAGMTSSLTM